MQIEIYKDKGLKSSLRLNKYTASLDQETFLHIQVIFENYACKTTLKSITEQPASYQNDLEQHKI